MKVLQNKFLALILTSIIMLSATGCSKNDDNPVNNFQKVVFKVEASSDALINMVVYGFDAELTSATSISSQSWTSPEIKIPSNANVASITSNARGTLSSSSLTVRIYIDGVLKKEGKSTGTALSSMVQYNLK